MKEEIVITQRYFGTGDKKLDVSRFRALQLTGGKRLAGYGSTQGEALDELEIAIEEDEIEGDG